MSKFKNVIASLVIGLLGSALWEWIVSPFFTFLYEKAIPSFIVLFNDSFYRRVAYSTPESLTYNMLMVLIVLFVMIPPKVVSKLLHVNSPMGFNIIYALIIYCVFMSNSIAHQTGKRTLRDIEVVAPYISDIEYKTLKSAFYRIDSKEDYLNLTNQIQMIMDEYELSE